MKGYQTHTQTGILLNANEASQNVDDKIKQEILDAISNLAFNRYPDTTCHELHDLYANIMNVPSSWILSGNGSDQMLGFLIQYYVQGNKTLYTLAPDFSMYDYYVELNHAKIEKFETSLDGSFDVDTFISNGKNKKVDMILFSNPNNPTGHAISKSEMIQICEAFSNIPVIFDEAYMEFGNESAIDLLKTYPMVVLRHADAYKANIAAIISERERMYREVKDYKTISFYPSNANFLYGRTDKKDILMDMFKEKNITIRNYADTSFRITIGTSEENEMVLDVLRRFEYANS